MTISNNTQVCVAFNLFKNPQWPTTNCFPVTTNCFYDRKLSHEIPDLNLGDTADHKLSAHTPGPLNQYIDMASPLSSMISILFQKRIVEVGALKDELKIEELQNCRQIFKNANKASFTCPLPSHYPYFHTNSLRPYKSQSLESNLKLAKEILEETLKTVRFSSNNLPRSRKILEERAIKQGIAFKDHHFGALNIQATHCINDNRKSLFFKINKQMSSLFTTGKIIARAAGTTFHR